MSSCHYTATAGSTAVASQSNFPMLLTRNEVHLNGSHEDSMDKEPLLRGGVDGGDKVRSALIWAL